MIGKDLKRETSQTQIIAIASLIISIIAIILTVYSVINVNNALQGYASWPAWPTWPTRIPTGIPRGLPNQLLLPSRVPVSIMPRTTIPPNIPILPTSVLLPTALPQTFIASTLSSGNGAPSGSHYNLNLIGVPKGKTADMTDSSGHRIFVPLTGSCQIILGQGDFAVLDGNCTDGRGLFQLPNPDPTNSGTTVYSVWARALGKPGGQSSATTCASDSTTGDLYCSVYSMVSIRTKGTSTFTNVSRELLYIYADLNGDGKVERVPLFDSRLENYYWQYDNNGLKIVQLRFYQVSTRLP